MKEQVLAINKTNISPEKITVYVTGNVKNSGEATLKKGSSLIQAFASTGGKKLMTGKLNLYVLMMMGLLQKEIRYNENAEINSAKNLFLWTEI